jgi:protein involved in polysaccharide export with SLBB domain
MKYFRCLFSAPSALLSAFLALALLGGCASTPTDSDSSATDTGSGAAVDTQSADYLRPGDRIKIVYNDIPDAPTPTEQVVPEDGRIILPRGVEVVVIGKKRTDVEREIASIYVDEKRIYRFITVTIERMASFISVGGEVRSPSSVV